MKQKENGYLFLRKIPSDFSEGFSLPKTVLLTVDTDMGRWFIDIIKNDEFSSHTLAEEPFTVVELSSRILNEYCQCQKVVRKVAIHFWRLRRSLNPQNSQQVM